MGVTELIAAEPGDWQRAQKLAEAAGNDVLRGNLSKLTKAAEQAKSLIEQAKLRKAELDEREASLAAREKNAEERVTAAIRSRLRSVVD